MSALNATLVGGAVAGALDIAYACLHYNVVYKTPPMRILQSVAAGVMGPQQSQAGGWSTAAVGLGLHFLIAMLMAAGFVIASLAVPALRKFAWASGPLYGLMLYAVMNYLVVPISRAGGSPPVGQFFYGALAAHILLVGLPIALIAKAMMFAR